MAETAPTAPADVDDAGADIPGALRTAIEEPLGAMAVALGLLVARDPAQHAAALAAIREHGARGEADAVVALLPHLQGLSAGQRFPLLGAAMPALRAMSTPQYRQFKSTLLAVIRADRQTDLFEWCLFQLLRHYLDPEFVEVTASRPRYRHLARVRGPIRDVLSVLAHQGEGDSGRAFALATAELGLADLTLVPADACTIAGFSRAVNTLADCYPLLKPRILKAMALAAADDGRICATEREIVTAVAAVMDCPLPAELALDAP